MRYRGIIAYEVTEPKEDGSDVYVSTITEKYYRGEVQKNHFRRETGEWLNDDIAVSNVIRVVADPFALSHCQSIKYAVWFNQKWRVTGIEIDYPNLLLTLGGAYHEQAGSDDQSSAISGVL